MKIESEKNSHKKVKAKSRKEKKEMKKYDVKDFSLEEKLSFLSGKNTWQLETAGGKLPCVWLSDGPNGLRKVEKQGDKEVTVKATAMPNLSVLANTWNRELAYLDGQTIADDCVEHDVDVLLAPGVNIKRTPLCGRNFEYFSEDPYLAGELAKSYIDGVQDKHVGVSVKHFCANNREYDRLHQTSEVDERALHEIYLSAFERAMDAKPWTVMCSYNPVNGIYASENKWLLKDILRGELGFDGLIMSDWGAVAHSGRAVKATLDLRMPGWGEIPEELKKSAESGFVSKEEIDYCAQNVLDLIAKKEDADAKKKVEFTVEKRHENAVEIAKEGIVLLKNEDNVLPLQKGESVALSGRQMNHPPFGGGGSANVQTNFVFPCITDLLKEKLGEGVYDAGGFATWSSVEIWNIKRAYQRAYETDKVVLFVAPPIECEGGDKDRIRLPQPEEEIIRNFAKYNENVIVCLYAGGAVDMSAWIDCVKGVVLVGFAGEGVSEALVSVLTGETNPSGKLAETFPLCLEDSYCGEERGNGMVEWYDDGIFVGYRHYDRFGLDVLFPFGHGLSYSQFEYSDLKIEKKGDTDFEVSYNVTNRSDRDGKEISQVYVKDVFCTVSRAERELKGFSKDLIRAGETKRVKVDLHFRSFAFYSMPLRKWHVENGWFEILIGASERDIRLKGKVKIELPEETQFSTRDL